MATILEVGQRVRLDQTETTVKDRWARGRYHQYNFADGRSLKEDIDALITAGRLVLLDSQPETPSAEELERLAEEHPAPEEYWTEDDEEFDSPYGEDRHD
jgi:hypothetical protein